MLIAHRRWEIKYFSCHNHEGAYTHLFYWPEKIDTGRLAAVPLDVTAFLLGLADQLSYKRAFVLLTALLTAGVLQNNLVSPGLTKLLALPGLKPVLFVEIKWLPTRAV